MGRSDARQRDAGRTGSIGPPPPAHCLLPEARGAYVELHCHSAFSLREGASKPLELVLRARDLGYDTLALTDHDGLYGAMEFAKAADAWGIKPITGAELTLQDGHHLTLLAATRRGYANLCRLISHAHHHSPRGEPRLDPALFARHADGLIALSGCANGQIPALLHAGERAEAARIAERYARWFGRENFFLELQQNLVHGDSDRIEALTMLAQRLGLSVVATNNVHYHVRARHRVHDVLVAIRHRLTLDSSHRERRANSEFFLKPAAEMAALFAQYPEAIANSRRIAARCAFNLATDLEYRFPEYGEMASRAGDAALTPDPSPNSGRGVTYQNLDALESVFKPVKKEYGTRTIERRAMGAIRAAAAAGEAEDGSAGEAAPADGGSDAVDRAHRRALAGPAGGVRLVEDGGDTLLSLAGGWGLRPGARGVADEGGRGRRTGLAASFRR